MTLQECEKELKRYEKIVKQSDKQEKKILELYNDLEEKEEALRKIYEYEREQQLVAKIKVEENLVVDVPDFLNATILFKPLDVLSGDIYSIYNLGGKKFLYFIADGQGHGVSPAITVFNVANIFKSTINFFKQNIYMDIDIDKYLLHEYLNKYILNPVKLSLIDGEQLSYTIIYLDLEMENISYAIGGMYPTYLEVSNEIVKIKANNLPLTKNTKSFEVDTMKIKDFQKILSYSDGILEIFIEEIMPKNLIKKPELIDTITNYEAEDDITVLYFEKKMEI